MVPCVLSHPTRNWFYIRHREKERRSGPSEMGWWDDEERKKRASSGCCWSDIDRLTSVKYPTLHADRCRSVDEAGPTGCMKRSDRGWLRGGITDLNLFLWLGWNRCSGLLSVAHPHGFTSGCCKRTPRPRRRSLKAIWMCFALISLSRCELLFIARLNNSAVADCHSPGDVAPETLTEVETRGGFISNAVWSQSGSQVSWVTFQSELGKPVESIAGEYYEYAVWE